MKNILTIALISVLFFGQITNAHKKRVHQYLTVEGYKLLEKTLLLKYPELSVNLGVPGSTAGKRAWEVGTLVAGAWREDEEDVVYKYTDIVLYDGGGRTLSHFWDPDNGDYNKNTFQLAKFGKLKETKPYENAYEKIGKYVNGGWDLIYDYNSIVGCPSGAFGTPLNSTITGISFSYLSLADFYLTGRVYTKGYRDIKGELHAASPSIEYLGEEFRKKIVWQILGRMCHLMQDMSVPAHVHRDCHGDPDDGIRMDSFEEMFSCDNDFSSNAQFVYDNYGGFLNPIGKTNPVHYLMYITAQMADHFGSNGPYEGDGNDILGGNPNQDEIAYLTTLNISSFGAPTQLTNPLSDTEKNNIRSRMIPQAISVTAGLLYWFVTQVNMASVPVLINNPVVQGTSVMYKGEIGNWHVSFNSEKPCIYYWEIKKTKSGQQAALSSKGAIISNYTEDNQWFPVGGNSPKLRLEYDLLDDRGYQVRCTVTDPKSTTVVSNEYLVNLIDSSPTSDNVNGKTNEICFIGNYPNPFNPCTIIKFDIPEELKVTVKIYNILSQEVAVLVDEIKPRGTYLVSFNASNLSAGIYFARMQAGRHSNTIKMQLIK